MKPTWQSVSGELPWRDARKLVYITIYSADVFMGSLLLFYQYKTHKSRKILHTYVLHSLFFGRKETVKTHKVIICPYHNLAPVRSFSPGAPALRLHVPPISHTSILPRAIGTKPIDASPDPYILWHWWIADPDWCQRAATLFIIIIFFFTRRRSFMQDAEEFGCKASLDFRGREWW